MLLNFLSELNISISLSIHPISKSKFFVNKQCSDLPSMSKKA